MTSGGISRTSSKVGAGRRARPTRPRYPSSKTDLGMSSCACAAQAVRAWAALEGLCCLAGGWRLLTDGGALGTACACNRLMTHRRCACRPCVQMLTCGCHEPLNSRVCDTLPRYTCAQGQGGESASGSPRAADGMATACAKPEPSSPACGGAGRAAAQSLLMLPQTRGGHHSAGGQGVVQALVLTRPAGFLQRAAMGRAGGELTARFRARAITGRALPATCPAVMGRRPALPHMRRRNMRRGTSNPASTRRQAPCRGGRACHKRLSAGACA